MESPTIHANSLRYNRSTCSIESETHIPPESPFHFVCFGLCVVCYFFFFSLSLSLSLSHQVCCSRVHVPFQQMELLTTADASFEEKTLSSQHGGVDESTHRSWCLRE